MVDFKSEEILTCLCLIVVGYFLAKMFSLRCDGFRVGGQPDIPCTNSQDCNNNAAIDDDGKDMVYGYRPNCQCLCKNDYTGRSCDILQDNLCISQRSRDDCISHDGCYYSTKNNENRCKSCESIDLTNSDTLYKDMVCEAPMTNGKCRYDLTSDKCISNN